MRHVVSRYKFLGLVLLVFPLAISHGGYQTTRLHTISASVLVGGSGSSTGGGESLRFQHTPLQQISNVTRQIIILAEAGSSLPPGRPGFESRWTPQSTFVPFPERRLRMRIQYRCYNPAQGEGPAVTLVTDSIEGPDPMAVAFEIPVAEVSGPVLEYKIIAEKIEYRGNQLVVLSSSAMPTPSLGEPDPYFVVGVQSNNASVLTATGGHFSLADGNPEDGETSVDIPAGLVNQPTTVGIDQLDPSSPIVPQGLNNPISIYHFQSDPPLNGMMRVSLLYPDFEFPRGQDGIVDGTDIPEDKLMVVAWDGFTWRRLGSGIRSLGTLSLRNNTLSMNVNKLGFMAVVAAAGALEAPDRRPVEKIITPNGDGQSDTATFSFGDRTDNIKIEIFDSKGHRVKTLMSQDTLQWDGRDSSGQVVESGVYIYQYTIDGSRVSGLVAVAK